MKIKERLRNLGEIKVIQKRFELITVARYRDINRIRKASSAIDKIREKTKGAEMSMTEIVRKWRDTRYGSSSS